MNESQKRLIEAERRIARLESTLQRTNTAITGVQGALRNDSQNVVPPFGSGGGGGTGGLHRFATQYQMWAIWDTEPTLITGASSNVPADGPALAEAIAQIEIGIVVNLDNLNSISLTFGFERNRSRMAQHADYDFRDTYDNSGSPSEVASYFKIARFDDGQFLADAEIYTSGTQASIDDVFYQAEDTANQAVRLEIEWPRRNGGGTIIGTDYVVARRTLASEDTFSTGPRFGDSGTWSFAMECPATTYHTSGTGTLYLRWGTAATPLIAGGTPGSLPTDFIAGGTPGSLPTDFIEGGSY